MEHEVVTIKTSHIPAKTSEEHYVQHLQMI